jgi:hypothetical protein
MNKKQALLVVAGLGSVLCKPVTKENFLKNDKTISLVEQKKPYELKKIVVQPEIKKEELSLPLKNGSHVMANLEKNVPSDVPSNEKKEKPLLAEMVKKPVTRTVRVSNRITKDMITYKKHWTGHYTPSKFALKINGQEVKQNSTTDITVTDNKVRASFDYEFKVFGKVQRVGGREFDLIVPENTDKIASTFSWDEPANLVFDRGTLVNSKDIS